jgi:hypothetical protein
VASTCRGGVSWLLPLGKGMCDIACVRTRGRGSEGRGLRAERVGEWGVQGGREGGREIGRRVGGGGGSESVPRDEGSVREGEIRSPKKSV